MCDPLTIIATIATGAQIIGGQAQANAQKDAGTANKAYYDELANMSEGQIGSTYDTARRQIGYNKGTATRNITSLNANAARDTATIEKASKATAGSQKAAFAASGVELGSATAEDVARNSFDAAALDKLAIRYNTDNKIGTIAREANIKDWEIMTQADLNAENLKRQAKNYRLAGQYGVTAAGIQANNTLLSTAGTVLNNAYTYLKG